MRKKLLMLFCLIILIFSIATVSAEEDFNQSAIEEDSIGLEYAIEEDSIDFEDAIEVSPKEKLSDTYAVTGNSFDDIYEAIKSAKSGDTIELSGRYTGNGNQIYISKSITIDGRNQTTLDAKGLSRIFSVDEKNVVIKNMNFINGGDDDKGGAIIVDGEENFRVVNCSFVNCSADRGGGAIYCNKGNFNVVNCSFLECSSRYLAVNYGGGAIYCNKGNLDVSNCSFMNCSDTYVGGAIFCYDSKLGVVNSSFLGCSAGEEGGAIHMDDFSKDVSVVNSSFVECSAYWGGAVYCDKDYGRVLDFSFVNCSFVNNTAINGGAIFKADSVVNCSFLDNYANYGGAIYGSLASAVNSSFLDNSAGVKGGVIYCFELDGIWSDCNFINNYAEDGGIVYIGGDDQFSSSQKYNFKLTYNDFQSSISNIYGGLISLDGNVLSINSSLNPKGNVTVKINGKTFIKEISSGKASFDLNSLSEGIYNASIHYSGDGTYKGFDLNIPIFIESGYKLDSSDLTKYYGGSEKFTVNLTNDNNPISGAKVKITVNGKQSTATTDSKGQASIDIDLAPGTYDALSEYEGVSKSSKITVKSTVSTNDASGTYQNAKVSATFLNTNGKALANTKVSFKVGSKTYTATTNSNGVATANVDLDVGTYNVTATNPKTNEQKTSKLTISKAKSTMTLSTTSNNDEVTLTASLSPNASGNVVFNLNNKNYTVKINNSKASQTITGLKTGNYTAKASYAGDKNLNSSSASTKVTVKKVTPTKIIYEDMQTGPVAKSEGRIGNYFCVKLVDDKNKAIAGVPIKIGFNGVIYNRTTNSEGGARLQINLANEDLYTFAICFLGDDDYQASFEVAKIDVNKKYPKPNKANSTTNAANATATQHESRLKTYISYNNMDTKSVLKVEGRAGEYFVVKLLDNNKKALADVPIKIGFNGVIYNRTTNATGEARLQINLLKPTLYTFAIAYLGDSKYQAAFEVAKITVKAQTPKLTSASKTFKASAKTKSLSATLVSARGAAISGQKLSFTVNGKTYTGKTNSKGVATVNISLNKKGTYSCSVKFAGMTGASAKTTKLAVKIT